MPPSTKKEKMNIKPGKKKSWKQYGNENWLLRNNDEISEMCTTCMYK